MVEVFKLEYKETLVGYRFYFKDYCYDISLEAIRDEDGEGHVLRTYNRISGGKGIKTLKMLPTSDGLLKTKDEIEGKIKLPIVSIEDVESEDGFYDREHLFTLYEGVLDEAIKKQEEESKEILLSKEDVIKMLMDTVKESKSGIKCGKIYDEACIKYGDYSYRVDMNISDNKLKKVIFDLDYDIEKYSNASFVREERDYDGWYKTVDTRHPDYKKALEYYDSDKLRVVKNKAYDLIDESYLCLEDKDWLVYSHIINITFKEPMPITKENISKIVKSLK